MFSSQGENGGGNQGWVTALHRHTRFMYSITSLGITLQPPIQMPAIDQPQPKLFHPVWVKAYIEGSDQ